MRKPPPIVLRGARYICEIPPGSNVTFFEGMPIIAAPGEAPYTFKGFNGQMVRVNIRPEKAPASA